MGVGGQSKQLLEGGGGGGRGMMHTHYTWSLIKVDIGASWSRKGVIPEEQLPVKMKVPQNHLVHIKYAYN